MPPSTSTAPPEVSAGKLVFQVASGYMASAALQVAMRLDIAARLSSGPRPVADLAREAGVKTDGLYRVLRALASLGIFAEASPRTFALTPAAELLRRGTGALGDGVEFITDPLHFQTYAEALHSVQTGQPAAEKVVGMPLFDYLAKTPQWSTSFNNAMPAVLKAYDFSGIGTLVDVAGGHGHVLTAVLRKYPQMRGVLFDLEHVIAGSGPLLAASGVQNRVRTESGDFFKVVPAGGDAYIMKHIIHDWDDERAATILRNIRKALDDKPQGRVILLEAVLAGGNAPDFAKLLDLEMMLFPGGRERTAEDFGALFDRAGFTLTTVAPTESMLSVVEARVR
jgi:hypothetical protein